MSSDKGRNGSLMQGGGGAGRKRHSNGSMITEFLGMKIVRRRKMRLKNAQMSGHPWRDRPEKSVNARFKMAFRAIMGELRSLNFNEF
eukprot:12104777-Karenia_brevis.AAC.1